MRRTLSSRATILWSLVLPVLVIAGLSCALLLCWLGKIRETDGRPMSGEGLCWGTLLWAFVVWGTVRFLGALKRVEVDEDSLYVSNYFTEVRIPFSEVRVVCERGGYRDFTKVTIGLRSRSPLGKTIEFLPPFRLTWSGIHPSVRELRALCKQAGGGNGVDEPTPFDPDEKIYEAPDDSVVQVGKDYILYGCEGRDKVREKDKFFFEDLTRITVIRARKSGRITAIDYKVRRKSGTFEIGDFKPEEMGEIARLLETRAKSWPIQFLEEQISGNHYVASLFTGLGAIAATICSGWLLHFGWTVRDQLSVDLGLFIFVIIFLPTLAVAVFLWAWFWGTWRD